MKITKTLLCSFLFFLPFTVFSYENELTHQWWANVGLGVGKTFNEADISGPAGQLSFNGMISPKLFLTFETTTTSENGLGSGDTTDTGILLGYKSKHPCWYWSGAAGLAYYKVERKYATWNWGRSYTNEFITRGVGIPVEGQLFWTPVRHFGVGLIGHGILNENPTVTALIAVQIS